MKEHRLEIKEKYLLAELGFSFLLLTALIFLFGETVADLRLYIILGLGGGFYCSWSLRNKDLASLRIAINIAVAAVFIWIFYSLFNSSFFYKEVIILFVKGIFFLAVLLSFGAAVGFLVYLEVLTLPLFMCFPLFVNNYNAAHFVLIAFCLISWGALLKLKFEGSFTLTAPWLPSRRYYSVLFSSGLIAIVVALSLLLFYLKPLRGIKESGFFIQAEEEASFAIKASEQKYYDLQERLQEKVLNTLFEFSPKENKSEILSALSSLIKESADTIEVKEAQQGLIDFLRRPGPGMEEGDSKEIRILLDQYLGEKIILNLKRYKDNIIDNLKTSPFSIKERFSVLIRVNKMQYANTAQKVESAAREVERIVNQSAAGSAAKKEIKDNLARFQEWKNLQLYYRQLKAFKKKVAAQSEETRDKLNEFVSGLEKINSAADLAGIRGQAKILKYTASKEVGNLVKEAEEIIDTAARVILSSYLNKVREKLRDADGLSKEEIKNKEEVLDGIESMEEYLKSKEYFEEAVQDGKPIPQEAAGTEKRLIAMEVLPGYSRLSVGEVVELLAMGVYDDDSRQDLSGKAEWSSAVEGIVSLAQGRVTGLRVGETKVYAEEKGIKSQPATITVDPSRLVAISLSAGDLTVPINSGASLTAAGIFSNGERRDITSSAVWKSADNRIVAITRGKLRSLRIGATSVYAEYSGVKSPAVNIRVTVTVIWICLLSLKIVLSALVLFSAVFAIFYALTEERRRRLKNILASDLRSFIITLYRNTQGVLFIFGPRYRDYMPFLSYAALVQENYHMPDNLYLRLTRLFTEAKYSNHPLTKDDASKALEDYNAFIKILLSRQLKGRLFLKYCLVLLFRRPLYI